MPNISSNFVYEGKKPNFQRDRFNTLKEMREFDERFIDEGHTSYCRETRKKYTFFGSDKENGGVDYDEVTGYWRLEGDYEEIEVIKIEENVDCVENPRGISATQFDAAHVQLEGSYRIPTEEDWQELFANTTQEWIVNYGGFEDIFGFKITSNINGESIFLKACNAIVDDEPSNESRENDIPNNNPIPAPRLCQYWSATFDKNLCSGGVNDNQFTGLNITYTEKTFSGAPIRPITSNRINGVDLGLPSGNFWCRHNLGAGSELESGNFYSWGETEPKITYNLASYQWATLDECKEALKNGIYQIIDKISVPHKENTLKHLSQDKFATLEEITRYLTVGDEEVLKDKLVTLEGVKYVWDMAVKLINSKHPESVEPQEETNTDD